MHAAITWESCAFIYVCVFVPMYACTYLSVHAWGYTRDNKRRYRMFIHVCMHVCIYGPTYVRDSSRSEILTFTHVWYVCLYANMYACRYMCTCKYVGSHTYSIHTKTRVRKPGGLEVEWEGKDMWYYTHTHTHTFICMFFRRKDDVDLKAKLCEHVACTRSAGMSIYVIDLYVCVQHNVRQ